jgi:hypothetical protein
MIPNKLATQAGIIPIRKDAVRFAVGDPEGLTSNSWRIWASRKGDIYIACRDNFKEAKVSLHASGRWRISLTTEAISKNDSLISPEENRALEVWDKPTESLPNTVTAFRIIFPRSELAVKPENRIREVWRHVIFVEAAPPGKVTVMTIFVTNTNEQVSLRHESEPSFCLASLDIGDGRRVQLIAHCESEGNIQDIISKSVERARLQCQQASTQIPKGAYGYFFGRQDDGCRFLVGARIDREINGVS